MNIIKQLYVSLFSPRDMASFRNQGMGKTIFFLFLLALISILPSSYHFSVMIQDGIKKVKQVITTEMPAFEIKDGTLTTEEEEPFLLNKNGFNIYMDSSGEATRADVTRLMTNGVAFLENELVFVASGQAQGSPYSFVSANNNSISSAMELMDKWLWAFLAMMIFIFYLIEFLVLLFKATVFSIFGITLKNAYQLTLSYKQVWTLTAYCLTLPAVFFAIMGLFQATVPMSMTLNFLIIFILLFLTVKEVSLQEKPEK